MTGRGAVAAALVLAAVAALAAGGSPAADTPAPSGPTKLRGDLAALVAGTMKLDPRIPPLVDAYQPGELAYFAVLDEAAGATHRATLTALGARVLRRYASVDAFALASQPGVVMSVAELPWVKWLAPVQLVRSLATEVEVDQSRATTADVGAPALWNGNPPVTGAGVTIAVLDTGLDPTHQDLDDLDFRSWSSPLPNPPKVADPVNHARDFNGGRCDPLLAATDGFGHGTHVAGIAAGTGEGVPLVAADDGRYAGIAPGANLAIAKVLTDAGAGLNSDLVAALEWAALPRGTPVPACPDGVATVPAVGAEVVNLSLGSEARPGRLNSDSDVDLVSYVLNRLAVAHGTLFAVAAGNSGPFIGSLLESPGAAAQALSVSATAKDWDVNRDDTLSGDACAGWRHPGSVAPDYLDNECNDGPGDQPPSLSSFTSRGPSGDVWLRPDVAAPGYNIVAPQAAMGTGIHGNDFNLGTRGDPLYATASGTSMATPVAAGSAALLLEAYRRAHGGAAPSGASGVDGRRAPAYVLLRAALMNTAHSGLYDARWILSRDEAAPLACPAEVPFGLCTFLGELANSQQGASTVVEARNRGPADPYVGPLSEGAGKVQVPAAAAALTNGVVVYSAAEQAGADTGTGHRDFQGSWQVGPIVAGSSRTQRFVLHAAPGVSNRSVRFTFSGGTPSDGSLAIPAAWVTLPGAVSVPGGGDALADLALTVPGNAAPGNYTGAVVAEVRQGNQVRQVLRVPVFAAVVLHDTRGASGAVGAQGEYASQSDVFGKWDTSWPSAAGQPLTGTGADWRVFPVELADGLVEARFSVYDSAHDPATETYDLYLYDDRLDLVAWTHPFVDGDRSTTDTTANVARPPSSADSPQRLVLESPQGGRYYLVVSRARFAAFLIAEGFGAFRLQLDEVAPPADLSLTKSDAPDPVPVGGELTYTLQVRNHGPGSAGGVVVTDSLPAGVTLLSAGSTQGTCTGTTTVTCAVGALASGTGATITIRVRPNSAGTLTNTASVSGNEHDPVPGNNGATATTAVQAATADLSVTNVDVPDPVKIGQDLTYTIRVTNGGPAAASGVTLDVALPKNAGYGSTATSAGTCAAKPAKRQVTCSLGALAAGASATVTVTVKPSAKGTITSTATVKATSPADPSTANNSATATTTVVP